MHAPAAAVFAAALTVAAPQAACVYTPEKGKNTTVKLMFASKRSRQTGQEDYNKTNTSIFLHAHQLQRFSCPPLT